MNVTALILATALFPQDIDPRDSYDVDTYTLNLAVRPDTQTLEGEVTVEAIVLSERLDTFTLDLVDLFDVVGVESGGKALKFEHKDNLLICGLPQALQGDMVKVSVRYAGKPTGRGFSGFHWAKTADGRPWINTSCQGPGAHSWWPCKANFFNPDDKPAHLYVNLTVPADLYGVSNGRLDKVTDGGPDWFDAKGAEWRTFHWRHDYPLETYTVTLNVAPYVVVEQELKLPEIEKPVPFIYYVLPENAEKAAVQFQEVPRLLEIFSEAFGPWPFPDSKFGLVETNFWGMEHSTAVAYGSSYPAWCKQTGAKDGYESRNRYFDYILVHEVAHEWWGNAVSAEHWGHFWIHEGFGTYAEAVYIEKTAGREVADEYFVGQGRRMSQDSVLYRGDDPDSGDAYSGVIYSKGAWVLNTLRTYVDDDEAWWKSLRDFNMEQRYGNATTEEFQAVLERNTGREWKQFFEEWFYGKGQPELKGEVWVGDAGIEVKVDNEVGTFHVPLDLAFLQDGKATTERVWLDPGANAKTVAVTGAVSDLEVRNLNRILGKHEVTVRRAD